MKNPKYLGPFGGVESLQGVYAANSANLRCTAIKLTDGGICLFSPVSGLGEEAMASLENIGPVTFLLAPNHYHNRGLAEYAEAYPAAQLCASKAASPRLEKQTGLSFETPGGLSKLLPKGATIYEPEGLKTGEVWMRFSGGTTSAWLVVDAICGSKIGKIPAACSDPGAVENLSQLWNRGQGQICGLVQSATEG